MSDRQNTLALAPLLVAFFLVGGLGTLPAAALPELQAAFSVSSSQVSFVFVAWACGAVVGSFLAAHLAALRPPAFVLLCGAFAGAVSTYLGSIVTDYLVFLVSYGVTGLASGVLLTTGHSYVGRSSNERSSSNISALDFALSLGALATPLAVEYLSDAALAQLGWRTFFSICSQAMFALSFLLLFLDLGGPVRPLAAQGSADAGPENLLGIVTSPLLLWFAAVSFLYHALEYGHANWFVAYGASIPAIGVDAARLCLVGFLTGIMLVRLVLSWVATSERMPYILALSAAVATAIVMYLPSYASVNSLYIANLALGMSIGAIYPSMLSVVVTTSDSRGAIFSSTALIAGACGVQISSLLMGAILEFGTAEYIYSALGLVGLMLLVSIIALYRQCLAVRASVKLNAIRLVASSEQSSGQAAMEIP